MEIGLKYSSQLIQNPFRDMTPNHFHSSLALQWISVRFVQKLFPSIKMVTYHRGVVCMYKCNKSNHPIQNPSYKSRLHVTILMELNYFTLLDRTANTHFRVHSKRLSHTMGMYVIAFEIRN
jgi:hypothetical protein